MASPFQEEPAGIALQPVAARASPAEARLFGTFRIVAPDGTVLTPTGRKARALLARLLLADGDAVTRDRLTTLLWSTRGDDQARASLRQTLYEMRAPGIGGRSFLILDRAVVRIATAEVTTDLDRLRSFPDDGSASALADLIGDEPPELLNDLDGIDPAFDDWLLIERTRRSDERRGIVVRVCERALADGDVDGVQRLAACLLAIDPADEAAARFAMRASHGRGDRDGVRQAFARVEEALRVDLGASASEETVAMHRRLLAARIPSLAQTRGAARVTSADAAADDAAATTVVIPPPIVPAPDETATPSSPEATRHPPDFRARPAWRPPRWLVAGSLVVLLTTLATWRWLGSSGHDGERSTLVVESLQATAGDAPAAAIGTGLSTELARMILGHDRMLAVADANSVAGRMPTTATFIVAGDAHSDAGMLYANVKLYRERDGAILWSGAFSRPVAELGALREQVASRVADVATCALGRAHTGVTTFRTETLRLFLGACEQKHGDWNESARLLQQVVGQQPEFAHGWAMLAAATVISVRLVPSDAVALQRKADEYALHALSLDPHEGEAYFARAMTRPGLSRWAERMAILEAGHAVEATNGQIDSSLAEDLSIVGRWREATVYVQRALDADPFGISKAAQRARLLGLGGDLPAADAALRDAARRFGAQRPLVAADFRIQATAGDPARALATLARGDAGFSLAPDRAATWQAMLHARAQPSVANDEAAYRALASEQRARSTVILRDVEMLVLLHRIDEAFAFADRLPSDVDRLEGTDVLFTRVLRPLRADPRFMTLAARLGLVAIWSASGQWPDFCSDRSVGYDCGVEAKRALSAEARPLVAQR